MNNIVKNLRNVLCLLLFATMHLSSNAEPVVMDGRIIRVVDGDTVALQEEHGDIHKIRLAGIDAPESRQPFGQQAADLLRGLVLGEHVRTLSYKNDRYGRTIATIFLHDQDINLAIIDAGFAWHYKKYASEQPRSEALAYARSELKARQKKLALWSDEAPIAPWEWRVAHQKWKNSGSEFSMKTQNNY
jgi:micrococcal nuclease